MQVLIITVLASLVLVVGAVLFLAARAHQGDFEHGDRLSLLPLQSDDPGDRDEKTDAEGESGRPESSPVKPNRS
jgi:hypothetical protein